MGHWERLTMVEAVKKYSGVDFNDWKSDEDAIAAAKEHHVELPEVPTKVPFWPSSLMLRGGQAHPAHLHLRLPRRDQPAGKAQAGRSRLHRAL